MDISKVLFLASSDQNLKGGNSSRVSFFSSSHTASFKNLLLCLFVFFVSVISNAQSETEFRKTLHDRSVKIVNTLEITDSGKYRKIVDLLVEQYVDLNKIHDNTKESVAAIKLLQLSEEERNSRTKKEEDEKSAKLGKLHDGFIAKLQKDLTGAQIEKIKDGMTYRVMPTTYMAYQEMIPTLTKEQKEKICNWLKEARELAMDEGTSDDKHKVFGKYKGKINNYLSAQGYDMKKEEKAWRERLREKRAKEQVQE